MRINPDFDADDLEDVFHLPVKLLESMPRNKAFWDTYPERVDYYNEHKPIYDMLFADGLNDLAGILFESSCAGMGISPDFEASSPEEVFGLPGLFLEKLPKTKDFWQSYPGLVKTYEEHRNVYDLLFKEGLTDIAEMLLPAFSEELRIKPDFNADNIEDMFHLPMAVLSQISKNKTFWEYYPDLVEAWRMDPDLASGSKGKISPRILKACRAMVEKERTE